MANHSFVTVLMPIRNEVDHIRRSLGCVLAQDYPHDRMEVIVIDGESDDGTRAIVRALAAESDVPITLLENPARIVPSGMNRGIRAAEGEVVIRVDGRAFIAPDYVRTCVETLAATGAWNVGGPQQAEPQDTVLSELAAWATTSPFGIGGSKFHYADEPQEVDTVYLGAYPRWVLEQVGGYDASLVRNQDYELNHRVRAHGGTIYFNPAIRSTYYGRRTLRSLVKQYFQYGVWKVRVLFKHPRSLRFRHVVAPLFVLALVTALILALAVPGLWIVGAGILSTYTLAALVASLTSGGSFPKLLLLPGVFFVLHASWGVGFWSGLVKWLGEGRRPHVGGTERATQSEGLLESLGD